MTAIGADPLRETAQRLLIEAHLAERNWHEARRAFDLYRRVLRAELGVEPGHALLQLLEESCAALRRRGRVTRPRCRGDVPG